LFGFAGLLSLTAVSAFGAALDMPGLMSGKVTLKSAGKLAFGPDGILFVGDSVDGKVVALDTGDRTAVKSAPVLDIKGINHKIAAALGTTVDRLIIDDAIVNPISKNIYISASRGRGPDALPVILRMDSTGKLTELSLDNVNYSVAVLPNPIEVELAADVKSERDDAAEAARAAKKKAQQPLYAKPNDKVPNERGNSTRRQLAISDMAYHDGNLYVAGLSNEEFSSSFRVIPFPFPFPDTVREETGVLMFHSSHARFETNSPIRTFVIANLVNQPTIFAAYSCSPVVKIPMTQMKPGSFVRGQTMTELGGGSTPLDMIVYRKEAKSYILIASSRAVFNAVQRLPLDGMERANELVSGFPDAGGVPFEVVPGLEGVVQMDKYDANNILLVSNVNGSLDLRTIPTP
jgi:hypothetical protein